MVTAIEMRALMLNLQPTQKESKEIMKRKNKVSKILTKMNTKNKYELKDILDKISKNVFFGNLELNECPHKQVLHVLKKLGFDVKTSKKDIRPTYIYW